MKMENVVVDNPRLVINPLICDENKSVFKPLLENPQVLESARVNLIWRTREELLKTGAPSAFRVKQVYVIPDFNDAELFGYLHGSKHFIWGSPVIDYCATYEKPLPSKPRVLYSMAFHGLTVSFTGFDVEIREAQSERIKLMAGQVRHDFSTTVSILLAKNCEPNPKYKAAHCWKKPVCSLKLVDEMWRIENKHVNEFVNEQRNAFSVDLFTDCVISVSGMDGDERTLIGNAVEENGGKFSLDMERETCTHLITDRTSGEKYRYATKWGIRIVNSRWLRKCLDKKIRFPEEAHHPNPAAKNEAISNDDTPNAGRIIVLDTMRRPAMAPSTFPDEVRSVKHTPARAQPIPPPQFNDSMQNSFAAIAITDDADEQSLPTTTQQDQDTAEAHKDSVATAIAADESSMQASMTQQECTAEAQHNEVSVAADESMQATATQQDQDMAEAKVSLATAVAADESSVQASMTQQDQDMAEAKVSLATALAANDSMQATQHDGTVEAQNNDVSVAADESMQITTTQQDCTAEAQHKDSVATAIVADESIQTTQQDQDMAEAKVSLATAIAADDTVEAQHKDSLATALAAADDSIQTATTQHDEEAAAVQQDAETVASDEIPVVGEEVVIEPSPFDGEEERRSVHTAREASIAPAVVNFVANETPVKEKRRVTFLIDQKPIENEDQVSDEEESRPLFDRMSHAPNAYMGGDKPPRRMRLRINTQQWTSTLLDQTASSSNDQNDSRQQLDDTLDPSFVARSLKNAATRKPDAPVFSALDESNVPDEIRHCYRRTAFPPPHFSPMSVDEEDAAKENKA